MHCEKQISDFNCAIYKIIVIDDISLIIQFIM